MAGPNGRPHWLRRRNTAAVPTLENPEVEEEQGEDADELVDLFAVLDSPSEDEESEEEIAAPAADQDPLRALVSDELRATHGLERAPRFDLTLRVYQEESITAWA